jgi:flagellar hook-length control protein FliK
MRINAKLFEFLLTPQRSLENLQISGNVVGNQGEFSKFSDLLAGLTGNQELSGNSDNVFMTLNAEELNFLAGLLPGVQTDTQNPLIIPLMESVNELAPTQNPVLQNPTSQNPVLQNPTSQNPVLQNPTSQNPALQDSLVLNQADASAVMPKLTTNEITNKENILSGLINEKGQGVSFDHSEAVDESMVKESSPLSSDQSKTVNGISVSNALKMNLIEDSPKSLVNSLAQVEKGGPSSFQGLASLTDLTNLKQAESLVEIVPLKDSGETAEIKFTKISGEQVFDSKSYTPFEITIKNGDEIKSFEAALVKNSSNKNSPNNGMDDLLRQVDQVNGQKAQLVLFHSEKEMTTNRLSNFTNQYISGVNEEFQNLNRVFSADTSMQIRKHNLQNNQTLSENQSVITGSTENGMQVVEALVPDDSNSKFGQSLLNQNKESGKGIKATDPTIEHFKMDTLIESNSGLKIDSQVKVDILNRINTDVSSSARQPELNSPVEFKLEMPRGGEKIPESGYFRIKIQPESLGKIDVQLKVIGNQMVARMDVESSLVRQVVESNLGQLKETLQENGIKVESISVDVSTGNDKNNEQFENQKLAHQLRQGIHYNDANMGSAELDQADEALNQISRSTNLKGSMSLFA